MKSLRIISRIFVGIVFIYSGFVKGIDPLGSNYKFIDYFNAFELSFLNDFALALAIILSAAEFMIGLALFFGIRMKIASWAALLFMALFTPLTLVLAISNPVTDCGCFGDAIILTNWQTFFKNLIILVPTLFTFFNRNKYEQLAKAIGEWSLFTAFSLVMILLSVYCYNHLPLIDYRPYKSGTHIESSMTIPEGAPIDEWESIFIYEKDGEKKEFDIKNLPDSTWSWVETKNILLKEGYHPPIHDFTIESPEDGDITDIVLANEGYTFLLISYDLNEASLYNQEKINSLYEYSLARNYDFLCMTSSTIEIEDFKTEHSINYDFYNTDEITLKTIVRSNPGLVLLKNGTILHKWHWKDIPEISEIDGKLLSFVLTEKRLYEEKLIHWTIGLIILLSLAGFTLLRKKE